jgi:hypothetical protein
VTLFSVTLFLLALTFGAGIVMADRFGGSMYQSEVEETKNGYGEREEDINFFSRDLQPLHDWGCRVTGKFEVPATYLGL